MRWRVGKGTSRMLMQTKALAWRRAHTSVASANAVLMREHGPRTAALFEVRSGLARLL